MPLQPISSEKKPKAKSGASKWQSQMDKSPYRRGVLVKSGKPAPRPRKVQVTRLPPGKVNPPSNKVNPPSKPKRRGLREIVRYRLPRGDNGD